MKEYDPLSSFRNRLVAGIHDNKVPRTETKKVAPAAVDGAEAVKALDAAEAEIKAS